MVAVVGTPRAWQEVSNIFASLQHKTQNKLLSMAVNSQVREVGEVAMAGIPQAEQSASCPFARHSEVAGNRQSINSSAPRKLKVERRALPSADESSALAYNFTGAKGKKMVLPPSANSLEWTEENQLAMHDIASVPHEIRDKNSVTEFVTLPQINPNPHVFVMKDADLIKLKKSFEESKNIRQRIRYVYNRSLPTLPIT
jgi:hypothetical protein